MRQGQQNRRGRGRSNNNNTNTSSHNHNSSSNNNSNTNGRKPQNPLSRNFESSGPDVKIRGTAAHIAEKYITLARDAASSGDIVMAENYLQHAEHYNRIIMAAQAQTQPVSQAYQGGEQGVGLNGQHRPQSDGHFSMRDDPQPMIAEPPVPVPVPAPLPGMEPQPAIVEAINPDSAEGAAEPQPIAPREADGRRRRRRYPVSGTAARANGAPEPGNAAPNGSASGNGLDGAGENHSPDEAVVS